jgi:hypothetical protein
VDNNRICSKWLREVWDKTTQAAFLEKRMLILNDFKGYQHRNENSTLNLNMDILIIPGRMTSQSQINNVLIYKPPKDQLKYLDENGFYWKFPTNTSRTHSYIMCSTASAVD